MMLIKVIFFLFNSLSVDMVLQVRIILWTEHISELTLLCWALRDP